MHGYNCVYLCHVKQSVKESQLHAVTAFTPPKATQKRSKICMAKLWHPVWLGEGFEWSANLFQKRCWTPIFQILFHHSPGNSLQPRKPSVDIASNNDEIQTGYISCVCVCVCACARARARAMLSYAFKIPAYETHNDSANVWGGHTYITATLCVV
jgi:hypothetical protein